MKPYWHYMKELTADEIYRGLLLGMFSEKLPPMFTTASFFEKMRKKTEKAALAKEYRYVSFDAVRNTGSVRRLNVPVPFGYEKLCRYINAYDFLPHEDKPLAKFALLVMLNAKSRRSAIGALKSRLGDLRYATGLSPKKAALRLSLLRNVDVESVLDGASKKHKEIRANFYRGTGIVLQNVESKIAMEIVDHFANIDIPVLPVHDSFIIEKSHAQELRRVMLATYKKYNNGQSCPVK